MAWLIFVLGLLLGVLIGVVLRDALDLYRQSRQSRKARDMNKVHPPKIQSVLWLLLALAVVLQLGVGGLLVYSRFDEQNDRKARDAYQACTTNWQQEFASAYKARIESSTEAANALEEVVRAVDSENPERFRRAVDDYLSLRDTQVKDQEKNPYPPLPDELCGEKP